MKDNYYFDVELGSLFDNYNDYVTNEPDEESALNSDDLDPETSCTSIDDLNHGKLKLETTEG